MGWQGRSYKLERTDLPQNLDLEDMGVQAFTEVFEKLNLPLLGVAPKVERLECRAGAVLR